MEEVVMDGDSDQRNTSDPLIPPVWMLGWDRSWDFNDTSKE